MRTRFFSAFIIALSSLSLLPQTAQAGEILAESGAARVVSGDITVSLTRGVVATPEPSDVPSETLSSLLDSVAVELDGRTVAALVEGIHRFGWAQREVEPLSIGDHTKIRIHVAADSITVRKMDPYDQLIAEAVMNTATSVVNVERSDTEYTAGRTVYHGLVSPEFWIRQQEHIQKQFFESIMNLDYPGLEAARDAYNSGRYSLALYEVAEFYRRKAQENGTFQRPTQNPTSRTHAGAERIVNHIFRGSDFTVEMGDRMDWQTHPPEAHGAEWLWALNHHGHFLTLLGGYRATANERYAKEYADQICDFVIRCPAPNYSLTRNAVWRNLDAGIRGTDTWPQAFYGFLGSASFTPQAIQLALTGLWSHGKYINEHPAGLRRPSNWSIVDSSGLCGISLFFPEFTMSPAWRDSSYARLTYQLRLQVYGDGSQYELAPGYHNLCLSRFQKAMDLTEQTGNELPEEFGRVVESMYEYVMWLTRPDGNLPALSDTKNRDLRGILQQGAQRFNRADMLYLATRGQQGTPPDGTSHFSPNAGYAVMRSDWTRDARYLLFDGGPVGSGHQHEDKLGILVSAYGVNFIIDTGSFEYVTNKWREHAVSTSAHSTALIDGLGQRRIEAGIEHYASETPTPHWESTAERDYVVAQYDAGYGPDSVAVVHRRHVVFQKPDYWVVVDEFSGEGEHTTETLFQFAPDITVTNENSSTVIARSPSGPALTIQSASPADSVSIVTGQEEPRVLGWHEPYDRHPAPVAVYNTRSSLPRVQAYLLYPTREADADVPTMTTRREGHTLIVDVTAPGETKQFRFELGADR